MAALDKSNIKYVNRNLQSPLIETKHPAKRKMEEALVEMKAINIDIKTEEPKVRSRIVTVDDDVINICEGDGDKQLNPQNIVKKPKFDAICEELPNINIKEENIKVEREDLDYDAFQVKQEHQGYDDDPIYIDSDSEDDESVQWLMRLSQSSPGKPFIKVKESKAEILKEENSYSQIDDDTEFEHNLISIPSQPQEHQGSKVDNCNKDMDAARLIKLNDDNGEEILNHLISLDHGTANSIPTLSANTVQVGQDNVDGMSSNHLTNDVESTNMTYQQDKGKRTQMIEPLISVPRKKSIQPVIVNESTYVNLKKKCIILNLM